VGFYYIQDFNQLTHTIEKEAIMAIDLEGIGKDFLDLTLTLKTYIHEPDLNELARYQIIETNLIKQFDETKLYAKELGDDTNFQLLDDLEAQTINVSDISHDIIDLVDAGKTQEALEVFDAELELEMDIIQSQIQEAVERQEFQLIGEIKYSEDRSFEAVLLFDIGL